MKFTIALILCFASCAVLAASKDDEYRKHMYKIYKKYSGNAESEDYKLALYDCGNNGNYYCSARLADISFDEKEYKLSFDSYTKCADKDDGFCDFRLGYLYGTGLGVLQNNTQSLKYYKQAAKAGVPEAAYNLSVYYSKKMSLTSRYSAEGQKKFNDYAKRRYAWAKVALAMGLQDCILDDEKKPAEQLLDHQKYILESYGLMASADKLAIEICSGIKACKQ
jgi:hypothetical protein